MKRLLIVAILAVMLSACGTTGFKPASTIPSSGDPVIVKVPTPINPPVPPVVHRPALAISTLTAADKKNPDKVAKAYKASIKSLQGYATQLETILDGYRNASASPEKALPTIEEAPRTTPTPAETK